LADHRRQRVGNADGRKSDDRCDLAGRVGRGARLIVRYAERQRRQSSVDNMPGAKAAWRFSKAAVVLPKAGGAIAEIGA